MLNFGPGNKVVVVLSGGIDSSVVLHAALSQGMAITVFHGVYGKPSSQRELAFAKWTAQTHRLPIEIVDLAGITAMQVGYVDPIEIAADEADMKFPELANDGSVSGFHTLISAAAYFTQITRNNTLALGLIREQAEKRPELESALSAFGGFISMLNPGAPPLHLAAPLIGLAKSEVVKLGSSLNVPFDRTWSCSSPTQAIDHCGVCTQCNERKDAFTKARVNDPTSYRR